MYIVDKLINPAPGQALVCVESGAYLFHGAVDCGDLVDKNRSNSKVKKTVMHK